MVGKATDQKMDGGYSWIVLVVAFIGQAMSVGFYFCFGPIYVEIIKIYGASASEAGKVPACRQILHQKSVK